MVTIKFIECLMLLITTLLKEFFIPANIFYDNLSKIFAIPCGTFGLKLNIYCVIFNGHFQISHRDIISLILVPLVCSSKKIHLAVSMRQYIEVRDQKSHNRTETG